MTKAGLKEFTLHDLKHTYGSLLSQDGASLMYVKEQMGHYSSIVTVDTCGIWFPAPTSRDRLDAADPMQQNARATREN